MHYETYELDKVVVVVVVFRFNLECTFNDTVRSEWTRIELETQIRIKFCEFVIKTRYK